METQAGDGLREPSGQSPPVRAANKILSGTALRVARAVWLTAVLWALVLFALAIPVRASQLTTTFQNLSPSQRLILEELGASGLQHARAVLLLEIGVAAVFFAVGLLIYLRRSNDWVAMLVSAGLVTYIARVDPPLDALAATGTPWHFASTLVQIAGLTCAVTFLYVFPDGRFVPGWSRFLLLVWALWGLGWLLFPSSIFDLSNPFRLSIPSFIALMFWLGSGIAAQVYRYLRVATPVQRQQTKYILCGMTVALLGYLLFGLDRFAFPLLDEPRHASVVYDLIGVPIFLLSMLVVPLSFAFSILRYRLWDIDLVINRVIVYATLTAILGGMYSAMITFSQRVFVALTGETSDAALVLTVLVVGATFTYLRGKLQSTVDRLVKPIPDPVKQAKEFGDRLRSFTELLDVEQLTRRTLSEAIQAFGAAGGALYLLRDGRFQSVHVEGEPPQVENMSVWLEWGDTRFGRIALGPRHSGLGYSDQDRQTLEEMVGLVARTMWLLGASGIRSPHMAAAGRRSPVLSNGA